jgi:hypothetical protein
MTRQRTNYLTNLHASVGLGVSRFTEWHLRRRLTAQDWYELISGKAWAAIGQPQTEAID